MNLPPVEIKTYNGRRHEVASFLKWVQAGDVALVPKGIFDLTILRTYKPKSAPKALITADSLIRLMAKARLRSLYDELCVSGQAHQGFRTEEIDKIRFYMFNLEENRVVLPEKCEVTGLSVTKGGYFREMKMQPPFRRRLLELMEVHQPDDKDLINPDGVTEYGKWVIKCPLMAKSIKIKWEINCLRHGFGSHYRAFTRNINLVAEDMGTDRAYVKKHYSRGVRVSETRSWLELSDDWNPPAEDVR